MQDPGYSQWEFDRKFSDLFCSLEIKDAMVEDSGKYMLKVSNDFGKTQTSADILVKGQCLLNIIRVLIKGLEECSHCIYTAFTTVDCFSRSVNFRPQWKPPRSVKIVCVWVLVRNYAFCKGLGWTNLNKK